MIVPMRATPAVVVAAVAGAVLSLPSTSYAATPVCHGKAATIVGTDGPDDLTGTPGDDVVWLGAGADTFHGAGGDDTVCLGPGADEAVLGSGDDWVDAGPDADWVDGGAGDDQLFGGDGGDVLRGQGGDDVLHGGAGSDSLEDTPADARGPDGADRYYGDDGQDVIELDAGGGADVADGGPGSDLLGYAESRAGVRLDAERGTASEDRFAGMEGYDGSTYDDVLRGTDAGEEIEGDGGTDRIMALGGDDTVYAYAGTVDAGAGDDYFYAFGGAPVRGLVVRLGAGDDRALLGVGSSRIYGGPGDDLVHADWFFGETGSPGRAVVNGGAGRNTLSFRGVQADVGPRMRVSVPRHRATWLRHRVLFRGFRTFWLSKTADTFVGGAAGERVHGLGGPDRLLGRGGRDVLIGGSGADAADGGAGRDTCRAEISSACERG